MLVMLYLYRVHLKLFLHIKTEYCISIYFVKFCNELNIFLLSKTKLFCIELGQYCSCDCSESDTHTSPVTIFIWVDHLCM